MASSNAGKIREIARLLDGLDIEVVAQSEFGVEDALETGATFHENSLIKALHAARATGLPAIADDSGLAVDLLDGAPGVRSARYAGTNCDDLANNEKLLNAMRDIDQRSAAFHCVATFVEPDGEPLVAEGEWRGEILREQQGVGGFGYDPLFFVPDCACSCAELSQEQKNKRSHRGQALRSLMALLVQKYS
jgi:XTP/dITP diphosphohydrolase